MRSDLLAALQKWHSKKMLAGGRIRSLLQDAFPDVCKKLKARKPRFVIQDVYNVAKGKSINWNPGCAHPDCSEFVKFSDNLRYKTYCSNRCAANCPDKKKRAEETCLRKYGTRNPASSQIIIDKIAATAHKTDAYARAERKRKQTLLKRSGGKVTNVSQLPGVQAKVKRTNLQQYGVAHANMRTSNREAQSCRMQATGKERAHKAAKTLSKRYGSDVTNAMHVPGAKSKQETTLLKHYGVKSPMHDPGIARRVFKSSMRLEKWIFKGKTFHIQGFEKAQIKFLYSCGIPVKCMTQKLEPIIYKFEGKEHYYYPDLVLQGPDGKQLIVETKSPYTAWNGKGTKLRPEVLNKAKAALKEHGQYLLLVFDRAVAEQPSSYYLATTRVKAHSKIRRRVDVSKLRQALSKYFM